jgi:hypothetical protein
VTGKFHDTHKTLILLDEVRHAEDTADVTRVITEEDTTKGGKGTHEIGLEGNWGLDALNVGRPRKDRSTRHGCESSESK